MEQVNSPKKVTKRVRSRKKNKNNESVDETKILFEDLSIASEMETSIEKNSSINFGNVNGNAKPKKKQEKEVEPPYADHLSPKEIDLLLQHGVTFNGKIRINAKFPKEAYILSPDSGQDYIVENIRDRNRALDGDDVYAMIKVKTTPKIINGVLSTKTAAVVVAIKEQINNRNCIGCLNTFIKKSCGFLIPADPRLPKLKIPEDFLPSGFRRNNYQYQEKLYLTKITSWDDPRFAIGGPLTYLGEAGTASGENKAIVLKFGLDITPYPDTFNEFFPSVDFTISEEEISRRLDCRKDCIFTIDPATAKDLDDAVSYDLLDDGWASVGVHIADVSHFLREGSPLDEAVSERATTVYLVDAVYHMLPRDLCTICSLTPGEDKLAFSVFWRISPDGDVIFNSFAKTVINSCAQLSYQQVQAILEDEKPDVAEILNGFSISDIQRRVKGLNGLAEKLRAARFESGALRIDQTKISFQLDPLSGKPVDFSTQQQLASHKLIEEFMLLANITVADHIQEKFPDLAFLRHHQPPVPDYLVRLQTQLERYGILIDITSSKSLQNSLSKYCGENMTERAQLMVINHVFTKPMKRANYFCSKFVDEDERRHYALSVPLYTHFTSPIRRYADVMVHRLLTASVYKKTPSKLWSPDYVQKIAQNCNTKKYNAKLAGDASSELFFALYIGEQGSLITEAVVCYVGIHCFEALVLATGTQIKVFYDKIDATVNTTKEESIEVTLSWGNGRQQVIDVFSLVAVELTRGKGILLDARLLPGFLEDFS